MLMRNALIAISAAKLLRTTSHRNDDGGYSFVTKQPEGEEEEELCREAMEGCPVEAIGDDGA